MSLNNILLILWKKIKKYIKTIYFKFIMFTITINLFINIAKK